MRKIYENYTNNKAYYWKWEEWKIVGDFGIFNETSKEKTHFTKYIARNIAGSKNWKCKLGLLLYVKNSLFACEYYTSSVHCCQETPSNECISVYE